MEIPSSHDKLLFTPGPLTTSLSVKQAMLHDEGSWHFRFREIARDVCDSILALAGLTRESGFEVVLMQGSGTFGVESAIGSAVPPTGKLLVLTNGAYGERMIQMAACLKIPTAVLRTAEDAAPEAAEVERILAADPQITHVAMVHCETTTGVLNPIAAVGKVVKARGRVFIVDAMSSFGGIPIDFADAGIDFLISSANKCIEGVPGFSFIIAKKDELLKTEGYARSLSLDLLGQWKGFQKNSQFRYTPPTHSVLAFVQALAELKMEGGVPGRAARYKNNHAALLQGMAKLGLKPFLKPEIQSYIITSFHYPASAKFVFDEFYRRLSEKGMIIYPGKLTQLDTFRIGTIGRLFPADMCHLVASIRETLEEMGVQA